MSFVLIIHEVDEFAAWKKIFDAAADIRKLAGEMSYQVLVAENNKNNVVHFSRWQSHEAARRFFESPELVEIRQKAGVHAPNFIYLDEIENGVL